MSTDNSIKPQLLKTIREERPLVHHLTNYVTVSDCASITLHWGALPVMAHSPQESGEMVQGADALVLNIGTLDENMKAGMIEAAEAATENNIPIVLDPVGVGATDYRTAFARHLLNQFNISVIKGNRGEISILTGGEGQVKGVESVGDHGALEAAAEELAESRSAVVVITGEEDLVAGPRGAFRMPGGHELLGENVGTGCMLASTIGAFIGAAENELQAAVMTAVSAFGTAAKIAALEKSTPAAFIQKFFDVTARITPDEIEREAEAFRDSE